LNTKLKYCDWIILNWSRTTLPIVMILLFLSPVLFIKLGSTLFFVFLQLPIYMIHQFEEHSQNKFKIYIDKLMGKGTEALTFKDIFYINILFVWVLDIIALYLALYVHIGFGLIAAYIPVINGISHIGMGIKGRKYNPGLWSSIFLFLPVGSYSILLLTQNSDVKPIHHIIAFIVTLVVHGLIMIRMKMNIRKIRQYAN